MHLPSLLAYLLSAALLMLVFAWNSPNVGEVPTWVFMLCGAPAVLARLWTILRGNGPTPRSTPALNAFGVVFRLGASVCAMIVGGLGLAMKGSGSLLETLWFMLPVGALVLAFTLAGMWLGARER